MRRSNQWPVAVAMVRGRELAPHLTGTVRFIQVRQGVVVTARINGLPEESDCGIFALHIHEGNSCGGTDFSETGGHYNPTGAEHPCHAGDLPPLFSCHGRAYLSVLTDRFNVCDIIGRTVVIHSGPDDFKTQPSGNSGSKMACGVIRRA